jgi:hypothetical protein
MAIVVFLIVLVVYGSPAHALYLTLENIGQESIVGAYLLADVQPFRDSEWNVALYSPGIDQFGGGPATDRSNSVLAFSIANPNCSRLPLYIPPHSKIDWSRHHVAEHWRLIPPAICLTVVDTQASVSRPMSLQG